MVKFTKTMNNNNFLSCLVLHFYIQYYGNGSIEMSKNFIKLFLNNYIKQITIEVIN